MLGPSAESTPPPLPPAPSMPSGTTGCRCSRREWFVVFPHRLGGLTPGGVFPDRTGGHCPGFPLMAGFGFRGFCVPVGSATPGSGNTLTPSQGVVLV